MRLLVAGGASFIGSNYVRRRLDGHPDDTVRVLDKLTYAGRRENLDGLPRSAGSSSRRDIADRDAVGRADRGLRRGRQLRRRVARRPLDRRRPASSSRPHVYGTYVLLEAARDAGVRYLQVSTDEVYGSTSSWAPFTEESPLDPPRPTRPRRRAATCSSRPTPAPTAPRR